MGTSHLIQEKDIVLRHLREDNSLRSNFPLEAREFHWVDVFTVELVVNDGLEIDVGVVHGVLPDEEYLTPDDTLR